MELGNSAFCAVNGMLYHRYCYNLQYFNTLPETILTAASHI
jgi:hypothetical protein